MLSSNPTTPVAPARPSSKADGACVLCRARKLRCDRNPRTCANCQKARETCITIEAGTGRQYARSYIDDLRTRAASLRARVQRSDAGIQMRQQDESDPEIVPPLPRAFSGGHNNQHFGGDSSTFSLGFLVAAAVSVQLPNSGSIRLNAAKRKHQSADPFPEAAVSLPPLAEAYEMVALYFDKGFHKVSPFMRRDHVYTQISRLYDNQEDQVTPQRHNDIFQVFMVFALGSAYLDDASQRLPGVSYYAAAMRYSDALFESPPDMQIRNTLLLVAFAYLQDCGIGSKWKLARQALRICVRQGYHKKHSLPSGSLITDEEQRRLFWCSYVQERFAACHLGRPFALAEEDISVELPRDMRLDETASVRDSFNASEVSVLKRQVQLRRISSEVRQQLYLKHGAASVDSKWKEREADRLNSVLETWKASYAAISTRADATSIFETMEYLLVNFHRERINIFAGLVVPTGPDWRSFRPNVRCLRYCLESSIQIISLYEKLAERGIYITSWTYVQDILRCGFMILYCGIHLPYMSDAAGTGTTRSFDLQLPGGRGEELYLIRTSIETCQRILVDIAQQWETAHPHRIAFQRLSDEVKQIIAAQSSAGSSNHNHTDQDDALPYLPTVPLPESVYMTDVNLWDVPFDVSTWDSLMDADMDMRDVFGFDLSTATIN